MLNYKLTAHGFVQPILWGTPSNSNGQTVSCTSPLPANHQGISKNVDGFHECDSDHSMVAQTTVVRSIATTSPRISSPGPQTRLALASRRTSSPSRDAIPPVGGVEDSTLRSLPSEVREIIKAAQRPSTQRSYAYKWNKFLSFLRTSGIALSNVSIPVVLDFLMTLTTAGLSLSSIKAYLSAISSHYLVQNKPSLFKDPLIKRFLKGLNNLHPPVADPSPQWSLDTVLAILMSKPFEPLATTDLRLLTWKTAFLVVITSARRAGELCALRVDQPFLRFHRDKGSRSRMCVRLLFGHNQ
ncbi:uncharacterized protein LOC121920964 [Sceloporus undulatus]|uniref:uncharacterized protein LOC121920964 n=1 Tax=Sceloporus undulatus TaxID=8520 RepID=UPI001C4D03B2|nr:uncharacterized protein LOC121920964 [Sceloporus undulatus]